MSGLVKIGFTDRDPITRSKELSSHTGVPGKFNIEKSWEVLGAATIEAAIFEELDSLRLDRGEFFKFLTPAKAINRVSSILLQLGELDLKGQTVPGKKRLAKQNKELELKQERINRYRAVEQEWKIEQPGYKQLALSQVESRLGYSLVGALREWEKISDHDQMFRFMASWWFFWLVVMTPPVGWILCGICKIFEAIHKNKERSRYRKVEILNYQVNELLQQAEVGFFKDQGFVIKHKKTSGIL
jgi:hypothetical protein